MTAPAKPTRDEKLAELRRQILMARTQVKRAIERGDWAAVKLQGRHITRLAADAQDLLA